MTADKSLVRAAGSGAQIKDIRGQKFSRLVVIDFFGRNKHGHVLWKCLCDCGADVVATGIDLRREHTRSCGCLKNEILVNRVRKHGKSKSHANMVWSQMISRCLNFEHKDYAYYGGRGIVVCDQWRESFETFIGDMGDPPPGMSIERKDNNAGYNKGNCRWATKTEQANNMRSNVMISAPGFVMTMADFARFVGLKYANVRAKVKRGVRVIQGFEINVSRRLEKS